MAAIEKFMFDLSFDDDAPAANAKTEKEDEEKPAEDSEASEDAEPEPPAPSFTEEELAQHVEAARTEAHAQGHGEGVEQGRQEILTSVEKTLADASAIIGDKLIALHQQQTAVHHQLSEDSVSLAIGIAKKIIPRYATQNPLSEVEHVLGQCLARLFEAPKVLVYIHPDLVDLLEQHLSDIAKAKGFDGQLMVLGDGELTIGDCRVDWGDGSAERRSETIWAEIDSIIEEAFASHVIDEPGGRESDAEEATAS